MAHLITGAENAARAGGKIQYDGQYQKASIDRWPFNKRFQFLWNEGQKWVPAWKDHRSFLNPSRGFFMDDTPNRGAEIDHTLLLDHHPSLCIRTLASGMQSGLTSPSRPWFRIKFSDPELSEFPAVKAWCDQVQAALLDLYDKANIYAILYMMYEEIATFSTAAAYIVPDFFTVMRGRSYTAGEYFLGCDPKGRVNAFARQFWMTSLQLVEEFGIENVTPGVRNAYEQSSTEMWVRVNQLIEENDDRVPGYKDFKNMKYRSLFWELGSPQNSYLRLGGYDVFPVLAPRWGRRTTADTYGSGGPNYMSLGHSKMLQKEQRVKLTALDKVADPPMQADASVQGDLDTLPGGVTRFSAMLPNAGAKPLYQIAPDIAAMREDIMEVKKQISDTYFESFFLMLINGENNPKMTAYEVSVRQSEKLVMLGPLLESLNHELLTPLNEMGIHYLAQAGLLPKAPKEIQGQEIKFDYISILATAQKMAGITAIDQWSSSIIGESQVNPDGIDIIDFDEKNRVKAEMFAVPQRVMKTPEQIAEIRQARAAKQAKAEQMQASMAMAKAARDGGAAVNSMGATPMGENSALDALLAPLTGGK